MENTEPSELQQDLVALQTTRDELMLKLHLAKADIKDDFHRVEKKWERLREELGRTARHAKEPIHAMSASTRDLVQELKQTYSRISSLLSLREEP